MKELGKKTNIPSAKAAGGGINIGEEEEDWWSRPQWSRKGEVKEEGGRVNECSDQRRLQRELEAVSKMDSSVNTSETRLEDDGNKDGGYRC